MKSVYEALPTTEELGELSASERDHEEGCAQEGPGGHTSEHDCMAEEVAEHDDQDKEHMFITPATSRSVFERTRILTTGLASSESGGKRPRLERSESKRAKTQCDNTITRYFLSQQ